MTVLRKNSEVNASKSNLMLYIVSDETPDRYGDVIRANGWKLDKFKKNSVALAHHIPDFVIGKWEGLHVINGQLRAHLTLADEGISQRIDEVRKLVFAGMMPAASVGFIPLKSKPRSNGGVEYLEHELCEISCVAIPANSNAVMQQAKSLGIRDSTIKQLFVDSPYQGSLAQRQAAARASLARAAYERTRRVLENDKADAERDEYEGLHWTEIVRREKARMRREEIGKEIDFRIKMQVGVRLAHMNHCGSSASEAAEQFMREAIERIGRENQEEQAIRDAVNARRHREYK